MRTLISNGTIVTADGSYPGDVLVDGEVIAQIGVDLAAAGVTADETIDATGKYVIPGGIDAHTHMELPFGGTFAKDTFETGTRAAAFGGTTSIVDFAVQSKGQPLHEGLEVWHRKAEGNAVVDYGFHMIMSDVTDATLAEMDQLVDEGVPDFKLFTAYPGVFYSPDDHIFRALQQTRKNGGLILMHAENGPVIDILAADQVAAGVTDPIGHGLARDWPRSRAPRCISCTCPPRRPCTPSWRREPGAPWPGRRPAPSTCTSRWTTSATGSRAPSSCARRPSARGTTRSSCGTPSSETTSR
jgi:dihydropyrimidinase